MIVAGGGVVGLTVALSAVRAGGAVTLYEPRAWDDGASGVAAGMIAPAFESALDPANAGRYALLRAARDLWPAFATSLKGDVLEAGVAVDRSGAIWAADDVAGEGAQAARLAQALWADGAQAQLISGDAARSLQPALSNQIATAVHTPEDWRVDPLALLAAMRCAFVNAGGRIAFERLDPARVGERTGADALVLAIGAEVGPWLALAPELAALTPIKGQILHYAAAGPTEGPMLHGPRGYVTPQLRGAIAGATMEVGIDDAAPDPATLCALRQAASRLVPALADAPATGLAGVRAATPDALPLVGTSHRRPGSLLGGIGRVVLAGGLRRNGWLLAPLVGEVVLADLMRAAPHPLATAFDPGRFPHALEATPPQPAQDAALARVRTG